MVMDSPLCVQIRAGSPHKNVHVLDINGTTHCTNTCWVRTQQMSMC